jgi:hypothetical protein
LPETEAKQSNNFSINKNGEESDFYGSSFFGVVLAFAVTPRTPCNPRVRITLNHQAGGDVTRFPLFSSEFVLEKSACHFGYS